MYIETSYPRQQGDNAKLNSPTLLFIGKMCIKFYYHMFGTDIETLNVIINGNKVFTASGDKGDKWSMAAIDVNLSGDFAVSEIIVSFESCLAYCSCNNLAPSYILSSNFYANHQNLFSTSSFDILSTFKLTD